MALTHVNEKGEAHMVDVGEKPPTKRKATASGVVRMQKSTLDLIVQGGLAKGDALAVARVSGIMAAKKTPDLIPLCHPLPISSVKIDFATTENSVKIIATVATTAPTGVEMEALTAVSVAALSLYDMIKAVDRSAIIEQILLEEKSGGKSGHYVR
ncbi:cyclic pyranopterin monophosphate synthase MoaC [Dethiosulfatarculus sandiegensis]|uniref:Cyclic pyranopterin monophosphate synthase n=1 Tax=Dethiosulfatarculus sandiegensis TaxID=1429043 RepID=A0A0D2GFD6_9BACT|nr:cyclic pyranopterin monophosphate synthase MoaC [Dethiosulfatarculus sandiegensis]KIX13642.1 molybdenum cofactor biosynthesis protein MoaC [Dethiosulfatarculus sandiegensis]